LKKRTICITIIVYLFVIPTAIGFFDAVAATNEDELLAEFAANPENLIPDMMLISTADIEVDYDYLFTGLSTKQIHTVTTTLLMPDVDTDLLGLLPIYDENEDLEDWGIPQLAGDKSYLVKNTTKKAYTKLDITTNFSIETQQYLLFDSLESKVVTSTTSIIASFGKTADANISLSAETYNTTLTSTTVYAERTTLWYNLFCETNETFPYCINIEVQNSDIHGFYIFHFDNNKLITDNRYDIMYLDTSETEISPDAFSAFSTEEVLGRNMIRLQALPDLDLSLTPDQTSVDDLNSSKMLSTISNLDLKKDMHVVMRGWKTGRELEDSLKLSWRQQLGLSDDDRISGYNLTKSFFQQTINQGLTKLIKKELTEQLKSTTNYNTLVNRAMGKYLPICAITNRDDVFNELGTTNNIYAEGFWDTIKSAVKNVASGITTVAQKVIDYPATTIGALGNAAANIITPVGQTIQGATQSVTNMVKDGVGHVTEGIVGVAGAAKDLGVGMAKNLKLALMIGIPVLGVLAIAGLGIYLGVLRPKQLGA